MRTSLELLQQAQATGVLPVTYSCCTQCGTFFRRGRSGSFEREALDEPTRQSATIWILPVWKQPSDASSFELSWDVTEAFFERMATKQPWVRPLRALVARLRVDGFDTRLRAGQSLNALGLSRARDHGLGPKHSHLFLMPEANGRLLVRGRMDDATIALGPVEATLDGALREAVETLARRPIE